MSVVFPKKDSYVDGSFREFSDDSGESELFTCNDILINAIVSPIESIISESPSMHLQSMILRFFDLSCSHFGLIVKERTDLNSYNLSISAGYIEGMRQ